MEPALPNSDQQPPMRDRTILAIKAVAITGVVLQHLANRRFDEHTLAAINVLPQVFSWSLLAFISISGWLHALSDCRKPKTAVEFLRIRALRLLVPYVCLVCFYALIWQVIQAVGLQNVGIHQPAGFWQKIYCTLPGPHYEPVAEQLYFLPLLFVITSLVRVSLTAASRGGVAWICGLSLIGGVLFFPNSPNTGFSTGMLLFGTFCYSAGYLLFLHRNLGARWWVVIAVSLLVCAVLGPDGIPKVIPVIILAAVPHLAFLNSRFFDYMGEASGTIYLYHTPFILQPLVILSTALGAPWRLAGALVSAALAIFACAIFHHAFKHTRVRALLM
jgi:peptidoglycan/LPS O-acetylase OafA/YrhL